MRIFVAIMTLMLTVYGKDLVVDFREAILYHDIRISINDREIHENQSLYFSTQPTWVIGIFHNGKWNKEVILRDGKYKKIRNTPYSVKLDGSIGLIIPDPSEPTDTISFSTEILNTEKKKGKFLLFLIAILLIIAGAYYWYKNNFIKRTED